MSLNKFLVRLIWLCALPLMLAAAWLAFESVRTAQSERDCRRAYRYSTRLRPPALAV